MLWARVGKAKMAKLIAKPASRAILSFLGQILNGDIVEILNTIAKKWLLHSFRDSSGLHQIRLSPTFLTTDPHVPDKALYHRCIKDTC